MAALAGTASVAAAPSMSVAFSQAAPGAMAPVPILWTTGSNAVSAQFDLVYPTNDLVAGTPVGGSALTDPVVTSSVPSPGVIRITISSASQAALTSGVLVCVPFNVAAGSPDHDDSLALTNVMVWDGGTNAIPANTTNGVLSVVIPPSFTLVATTNGAGIHLRLNGTTGRRYVIAASTNLAAPLWTPLSTNVAFNGGVDFVDATGGTDGARFYRAFVAMQPGFVPFPVIGVGSRLAVPGTTNLVAVSYVTDTNTSAVQFDLVYSTNYLAMGAPVGAPVGGSALSDHIVSSSQPSPGVLRINILSFSNALLTNGVLAYVPFSVAAGSPDHDEPVALANLTALDTNQNPVLASSSGGTLEVVIPPRLTLTTDTNGAHVRLAGTAGRRYVISLATNLAFPQWTAIATNVAAPDGGIDFLPAPSTAPARFFRASILP